MTKTRFNIFTLILLSFVICSCGQKKNSHTLEEGHLDDLLSASGGGAPDDKFFEDPNNFVSTDEQKAMTFIKNNCTNCHTGYHNDWIPHKNSNDFVGAGLIKVGDAAGSIFIQKLKNAGGNMPLGGAQASAADYAQLQKWINEL